MGSMKWVIWALASFFYFYEYLLRVSPSVMVPELMATFHIEAVAVGVVSAFYFYAYAPMQLPVGVLMDRYGARKLLTVASWICAVGALLFGISYQIWLASFARLLIGIGSSFAFVGMVFICSHWFAKSKRALLIGLANSIGMLGAVCGEGPLSVTIEAFGWRETLIGLAIVGAILGSVIYFLVRNDPPSMKKKDVSARSHSHMLKDLKMACVNHYTWINAVIALCFYMTTTALGGLWGVPYLQSSFGMSRSMAGFAMSMSFVGWLIGGPIIGFFSDRLRKRRLVIMGSVVLTFIFLAALLYLPDLSYLAIFIILLFIGFFSSAQLLNFSLAIELNKKEIKGSTVALTNFMVALAGSVMQPFVGYLLDLGGGTHTAGGELYSRLDYQMALTPLPILLVVAFLLCFFIRDQLPKTSGGGDRPLD